MTRIRKAEGIILRRRNLQEADRILTIYSKHFGKIRVVAKGIRKITSRKAGSLELFNHVNLVLARGRNLDIVTEVEIISAFTFLRKNLLKATIAYYFCELVDRLTPDEQDNPQVFELLKENLLKIKTIKPVILVRQFEEDLLNELGFGIPENIKKIGGSLRFYIEDIIEKKLNSPEIVKSP